jgi:hypothetical protein
MAQQKISITDNGSRAMRVLEAVTPVNAAGAPAVNAKFLGQIYVNETDHSVYVAKLVGSVAPADDWMKVGVAT